MHRGTVSSEESAPGSVTGEPPAPLPRCDMQQEKSPGGPSGTAHKIEGANCLKVGIIWDARKKHLATVQNYGVLLGGTKGRWFEEEQVWENKRMR